MDGIASATGRLMASTSARRLRGERKDAPDEHSVMDEWDEVYPGHRFHYAMQRISSPPAPRLRAVDGPVADYRDEDGLRKSCLLARSLGFDGKWCIHPAQIETVNEVFQPTEEETEWAKKVLEAYEEANAAGRGAITLDGQMIDAASIRMARNTLDQAPD